VTLAAKLFSVVVCAAACLAQDPAALFEKAPPDIDEALRARVSKFYQLHVENKFRAADALVAEDSKDTFFAMDKPRCRSFALGNVNYSDNFTRARVMIACDTEMPMMMAGRVPVKMPVLSLWKVVDKEWFWYTEPPGDKEVMTPFGLHKPAPEGADSSQEDIRSKFVDPASVSKLIKTNKKEVRFMPAEASTESVVVTNGMPGGVTLTLQAFQAAGLEFNLDRTSLNRGESATLSVRYQPVKDRLPSATVVEIVVAPTGQVIPINIAFGPPPRQGRAN
jgi:hypothetical protein